MIIDGIANWGHVHSTNPMDDTKYTIDLTPDAATMEKLKDAALKIAAEEGVPAASALSFVKQENKDDQARGTYFTGKTKFKPAFVDSDGVPIPESILLNNGSKVRVKVSPYPWTFGPKRGVSFNFETVMLLEMAEREGGEFTPTVIPPTGDGYKVDKSAVLFADETTEESFDSVDDTPFDTDTSIT